MSLRKNYVSPNFILSILFRGWPTTTFKMALELIFRTDDEILMSSDGTRYMPTEVIITNIKDPSGREVLSEPSGDSTEFELGNAEPMFDPMHNFFGYRILLQRSEEQSNVQH